MVLGSSDAARRNALSDRPPPDLPIPSSDHVTSTLTPFAIGARYRVGLWAFIPAAFLGWPGTAPHTACRARHSQRGPLPPPPPATCAQSYPDGVTSPTQHRREAPNTWETRGAHLAQVDGVGVAAQRSVFSQVVGREHSVHLCGGAPAFVVRYSPPFMSVCSSSHHKHHNPGAGCYNVPRTHPLPA